MPDLPFAVDELGCLGRRVLGDPRARVPRLDAETIKLVDLLKTKTPSLGNHEVDVEDSEDQNTGEDQENQRADILSDCKSCQTSVEGTKPTGFMGEDALLLGAKYERRKFQSQLVAVPKAILFIGFISFKV